MSSVQQKYLLTKNYLRLCLFYYSNAVIEARLKYAISRIR